MIDRDNPYESRRRPREYKGLREPNPQQSGKGTSRHPAGLGDTSTKESLRGRDNPFSAAHVAPRKK